VICLALTPEQSKRFFSALRKGKPAVIREVARIEQEKRETPSRPGGSPPSSIPSAIDVFPDEPDEPLPFGESIKEVFGMPPGKEKIKALRQKALEFKTYHAGKTYDPQEYLQEVTELKRTASKRHAEYQTMVAGYDDPTVHYITPKEFQAAWTGKSIPGNVLARLIREKYGAGFREQEQALQKAWSQASSIATEAHPETKITFKPSTGYEIKYLSLIHI